MLPWRFYKCFKKFMDNIHVVKQTTVTVEKKPLALVLPYLGSISLQTRTKLNKSLKDILNCWKLQIVFKNKTKLGNNFHLKDQIPKDLTSGVVYKFGLCDAHSVDSAIQCGLCNESYYGETYVWDTSMLELVNILVYHHLPENKLSLSTAP